MNNVTLNTKRPMKGTSVRLGITCSSLFPGASAGLIVKAKSMPTLPWYAIKFIVSGISTFGLINLLIYGAYIKKWWQNIIESILSQFLHGCRWCWRDIFPCQVKELSLYCPRIWICKTDFEEVHPKMLIISLKTMRIDTVTVKLRAFLMCLAYSFKREVAIILQTRLQGIFLLFIETQSIMLLKRSNLLNMLQLQEISSSDQLSSMQ